MANDYDKWALYSRLELVEEIERLEDGRDRLEAERDRLHSWDGLMELLDEHWPEWMMPTLPDREGRDPGPRIVSLLRWVDRLSNAERDLAEYIAEQDRLNDLVTEFRKREETHDRVRNLLAAERDKARAETKLVRAERDEARAALIPDAETRRDGRE